MNDYENRSYFFDQGIRFECQGCGQCCCGAPGVIRVTMEEIVRIAEHLSTSSYAILETCVFPYESAFSIRERTDGSCLFYETGCRIYPVRPLQCRTFPFWFNNMRSEKKWEQTCRQCPGIGQGPVYNKEQILSILNKMPDPPLII